MISLKDYFMGRDVKYPLEMSPTVRGNAAVLLNLVNGLLERFPGVLATHPNGTHVSSGWRPPSVNGATPGAAPNSKHMTGQAIDIYDPDESLDNWLVSMEGQAALKEIGLWMEHPSATKGWSHIQSLPPKSRNRVFFP